MDNKPQLVEMISRPKVQEFISAHENDDEKQLLLRYREIEGVPAARIVDQIRGRRKAKEKLPTWYSTKGIVYPPGIAMEQCSSEATAAFKVAIAKEAVITKFGLCDLTGGMGVDAFFLSKIFHEVDFVEKDEMVLRLTEHNLGLLGATNIAWHPARAEDFIHERGTYDFIFADPARRDDDNKKVFRLEDCDPDITSIEESLWSKTDGMLIKASPLLDLQMGLSGLRFVKTVYILAVANECKEVLFLSEKNFSGEPEIRCHNLQAAGGFGVGATNSEDQFRFRHTDERTARATFSKPLTYVYEPNAALMKAGAFRLVSNRFNLNKLAINTHLYTNDTILSSFPGRIFSVVEPVKLDNTVAQKFPSSQANVISRNHPLTVEEIRKKTGLREGGELYLLCCSGESEKYALICKRLK
jgi:hypothetical protein